MKRIWWPCCLLMLSRRIIGTRMKRKSSRPLILSGTVGEALQALVPLEILHVSLVLFGRGARLEGAEITALAGLRVDLARIEPVLAGSQLADHGGAPFY